MCEFCHKHGEGKKWYLQAKNYADDLLSDIKRRSFVEKFFKYPETIASDVEKAKQISTLPPAIGAALSKRITRNQKEMHFGQVIPLEDVRKIFEFVTSIVRLECICRKTTVGNNQRYCYAVSLLPNGGQMTEIIKSIDPSYLFGPENKDLEVLSKEDTLKLFEEYEKQGMCHTVWTFGTPFISGLCNCNAPDCHAMRMTLGNKIPTMFKAEYMAAIDKDACTGCKSCMKVCQFDALIFDNTARKMSINETNCYGCGICRSVCKKNAIKLKETNQTI
ncbi:MAG: 4Fe-4S ferredoxin [Elusimicrobia bacterium RIFOXYA2_FULL_39_19]|nr:MAG: 4Fe-4S ferredoxin [Elusimicrobia bacterium RIFOXYA2_FULL_39_19]